MGKRSFVGLVRSYDFFGTMVQINYKGDGSYRTIFGGLLSILFDLAIMTFLVAKTVDLYNFKDPQITSYEIFESRAEMEPINLAEANFGFYIGLQGESQTTEKLDPRFGTIKLQAVDHKIGFDADGEFIGSVTSTDLE